MNYVVCLAMRNFSAQGSSINLHAVNPRGRPYAKLLMDHFKREDRYW
jgi:hypothetical protein